MTELAARPIERRIELDIAREQLLKQHPRADGSFGRPIAPFRIGPMANPIRMRRGAARTPFIICSPIAGVRRRKSTPSSPTIRTASSRIACAWRSSFATTIAPPRPRSRRASPPSRRRARARAIARAAMRPPPVFGSRVNPLALSRPTAPSSPSSRSTVSRSPWPTRWIFALVIGACCATASRERSGSWDSAMPGYAAILAMYAFGLEENGAYRHAERLARRALTIEPGLAPAIHVLAHVMEMQGAATRRARLSRGERSGLGRRQRLFDPPRLAPRAVPSAIERCCGRAGGLRRADRGSILAQPCSARRCFGIAVAAAASEHRSRRTLAPARRSVGEGAADAGAAVLHRACGDGLRRHRTARKRRRACWQPCRLSISAKRRG